MGSTTFYLGLFLSVLNMSLWGCWTLIRVKCRADGVKFCTLFIIGDFICQLILVLAIEYSPSQFAILLNAKCDPSKVISIMLGGFFIAQSDFLCASATEIVPVYIIFPIYTGLCMASGMIVTYVMQKVMLNNISTSSTLYLFAGILFAILAVFAMAKAESYQDDHEPIATTSNTATINPITADIEIQSKQINKIESNEDFEMKRNRNKKWIIIMIFGGIICSLWSPASFWSRMQSANDGGVGGNPLDSYVCLFYFAVGKLMAIPMIYNHGIAIGYYENKEILTHIYELYRLPLSDKLYGILSGSFVGGGFYLYFKSSNMIATTAALGIASCEPLMNIFVSILFLNSLKYANLYRKLYMLLSVILFILAILFMALSAK
jgi:hypothetical protein